MSDKCSVLVADDNRDAADTLVELLVALGHPTRVAYDGVQAYQEFLDFEPDVAILDVQMPHMDGCAAAARMRAHPHPPKLIASLTAMAQDEEPMRSSAGVFDVQLCKPCEMTELDELLDRGSSAADADEVG